MKNYLLAVPVLFLASAPAHATAGMFCTTGGAKSLDLSLTISHVVAGPLVSAALIDDGVEVPSEKAQWWLDEKEMRLILIDPNAEREELVLMARRRGDDYVGTVKRGGKTRAVRCEESG